jgi:hypothetical protein
MTSDVRRTTVAVRDAALHLAADEATSETQSQTLHLIALLCDTIDLIDARQLAPVVPIARGPLDYQPDAAITLATVVPDDADREWWKSRIVPLGEDE